MVLPVAPEKLKFPEKACAKELLIEAERRSNAAKAKRDRVPERPKTALTEQRPPFCRGETPSLLRFARRALLVRAPLFVFAGAAPVPISRPLFGVLQEAVAAETKVTWRL